MKVLDINKLEQFDILLVRFPEDEQSKAIRKFCDSNYSHAIIYLGSGSFVEGAQPAVSLFSYHRYYFENTENVKMLRLNEKTKATLNSEITENFIRRLTSCNYSKRLLFYMKNQSVTDQVKKDFLDKQIWTGGIVCTTLITLPYYLGGIDLSGNNEPYYANFKEIENFKEFIDVTDKVFIDKEKKDLDFETYDYLTTYKTNSFLENQRDANHELNNYVQKKFIDISKNPDKYGDIIIEENNLKFTSWEDMLPNLTRWFLSETGQNIDKELSEIIINTGYNMLWFEDVHQKRVQFFPMYYYAFTKFKKTDLKLMRTVMNDTLIRMEKNEQNVFQNFSFCPGRTFHILLDMYRSFNDQLRSTVNQYDGVIKQLEKGSL